MSYEIEKIWNNNLERDSSNDVHVSETNDGDLQIISKYVVC